MCDETPRSMTLNREAVHDLRNLFGIVQSASRLLETTTDADRRGLLLNAIADAADRGATVSRLLLRTPWPDIRCFDLNDRLRAMQPMLAALASGSSRFTLDLAPQATPLRADLDDFEASLIELVTNGCAAHDGGSRITIRTRVHDGNIWLMVIDGERPFAPAATPGARCSLSTRSGDRIVARRSLRAIHRRSVPPVALSSPWCSGDPDPAAGGRRIGAPPPTDQQGGR